MRTKCEDCSKIFENYYLKTVFIQLQTKDIVKSRNKDERIYKKVWTPIGYLCEKCGKLELVQAYHSLIKQPISMYKSPITTKKSP